MHSFKTAILLIALLVACNQNAYSQRENKIHYQKEVFKKILSNPSLHAFFEDKSMIYLIGNEHSVWEAGTAIKINNKKLKIINKTSEKNKALEILTYETTDNIIYIQLNLFRDTATYSALYKKRSKKIKLQMNNMVFIKNE